MLQEQKFGMLGDWLILRLFVLPRRSPRENKENHEMPQIVSSLAEIQTGYLSNTSLNLLPLHHYGR